LAHQSIIAADQIVGAATRAAKRGVGLLNVVEGMVPSAVEH
jgi:hypothetical protein